MKILSNNILIISLVSRDWQVDRSLLLKKNLENKSYNCKVIFFCTDKFSNGNSKLYLEDLGIKYSHLLPEIETFSLKNYLVSTEFILNIINNYIDKKKYKILLLLDNFKSIYCNAFRNIKYITDCKMVFLQHGENYFSEQSFNYKDGWVNENDLKFDEKVNKYFKECINSIKLKILDAFFFYKISSKFNISTLKTIEVIFFKKIGHSSGFLNFGDKIFVSNNSAKKYLLKKNISNNLIEVVGSFLREKHIFLNHKNKIENNFFDEIIFFSTGGHRDKSQKEIKNDIQNYIYNKTIKLCKQHKKSVIFKLKPGEELFFKNDFPNINYCTKIIDIEKAIEKSKNPLFFLPADSTLTLEFSLQKTPYVIYSMWQTKSKIFRSNLDSKIECLNDINKIDEQLKNIFNYEYSLNYMNDKNLKNFLGETNHLPSENICDNVISLLNEK